MNFIVNVEEHIVDLLKMFKKSEVISENVYKNLKLRGSRLGIFYGLCKVHKQLVENCPPCRLTMPGVKSSYNLAKFLVPLLELITANTYTVKNSF